MAGRPKTSTTKPVGKKVSATKTTKARSSTGVLTAKTKTAKTETAKTKTAKTKSAKTKSAKTKTAKTKTAKTKSAKTKTAKTKTPAVAKAKRRTRSGATGEARHRLREDEAPTVEIATPHTERSPSIRAAALASAPPVPASESDGGVTREVPSVEARPVPPPRASERVLMACAEVPTERLLTDEEREAMLKVAETARTFVGAEGEPIAIVAHIATYVDEVRLGKREEPKSQDIRLGLGVLWGEQVRSQVGWCWVHLTYPDGFASYALVPDDRAFACFPLNRVPEALRAAATNTSAHVFQSIREGSLPARRENAYLVIG